MIKFLFVTIVLAFFHDSSAQAPLISTDLNTTLGTSFKQYQVSTQESGDAGSNVTWDFSGILNTSNISIEISETGSDHPDAVYSGANHFWSANFDGSFIYFAVTSSSYDYYGEFSGADDQIFYTNPVSYLQFPTSYELAYVDSFFAQYTFGATTGTILGEFDALVDGYGTLILPWGTLENVYRVTGLVTQSEQFVNAGVTTLAQFEGTNISWFAAGFPGPVMSITNGVVTIPDLNIIQEQSNTLYLGNFNFLGVDDQEIVTDLKLFPNPTADVLTISFSQDNPEFIELELLDVRGRKFKQVTNIGGATGNVNVNVDVSDIPAGFYLLKLSSEKGVQSRKVVVK